MKNKLLSITEDTTLTDEQKVGEIRHLAENMPKDTIQQAVALASEIAFKEGIKAAGEWLTDRPYAYSSISGSDDRRVSVKDISRLKIKGEIPR
jgi:hypothetical protein